MQPSCVYVRGGSPHASTVRYARILCGRKMLVKLAFPSQVAEFPDVDMLRCKEANSFATECVLPRRPKRCLPPLPEDKECSSSELKRSSRMAPRRRKYRKQCLKLPALPEHDEC